MESDFKEAMELLPSRDQGGEWEKGRATCGAAAGYYARALMVRHKFKDALTVLKDIIGKKYGTYELMDNYGDNFREGPAYENNKESLFEVQFLDLESQGTDDEWTPVNTSPNATQGSAIESNFAPGNYGLLCGAVDFVFTFGSTEQHVGVAHQTQVIPSCKPVITVL